jgi:hypothetical protein
MGVHLCRLCEERTKSSRFHDNEYVDLGFVAIHSVVEHFKATIPMVEARLVEGDSFPRNRPWRPIGL